MNELSKNAITVLNVDYCEREMNIDYELVGFYQTRL